MRKFLWIIMVMGLALLGIINAGGAATLTVQTGGAPPAAYPTIEAALAVANPLGGDTIKVLPGTYNPPAGGYVVGIPVQIVSTGADKTIIKTSAPGDFGFIINHSDVVISGFYIKPPYNTMPGDLVCGVLIGGAPDWTPAATPLTGVTITKCIVELFSVGINVRNAHGTVITNNIVRNNTYNGLGFWWQGTGILLHINTAFDIINTEISHNQIYDNQYYGVMLDDVSGGAVSFNGTKITANTFYHNGSQDLTKPSNWNSSAVRILNAVGNIEITNNKFLNIPGFNYIEVTAATGTVISRSGNRSYSKLTGALTGGSVVIDP